MTASSSRHRRKVASTAGARELDHLPVLASLRSLLPRMTTAEAAVARAVLRDPVGGAKASVQALATVAQVSTATVVRTCRVLGFAGFRDFRTALIADVSRVPEMVIDEVGAEDGAYEIAKKVFAADIEAIQSTLEMLDAAAFVAAVDLLGAARRIEVYGIGSSGPVATDAYYRLLRLGMRVGVATDAHMQAVGASLLEQGDVALVVSHTGRTVETLNTARIARAAGAKVLAVTSFLDAPLAEHADLLLVAATAETAYRTEAMASRIAHLSIVDALYVALAHRGGLRSAQVLQRTGDIIEERRVAAHHHDQQP